MTGCSLLQGKGATQVRGASRWLEYNSWDGVQDQLCDSDEFMTGLDSYHDNGREDRRYRIRCTKVKSDAKIEDNPDIIQYPWPGNPSLGEKLAEPGLMVYQNVQSLRKHYPWANTWDEHFTFTCDAGAALVGMYSVHANGPEDRQFSFKCGQMGSP